ncbi:hypothetical protein AAFF_G00066630 [Aldrovandia affinis]|uniref:C2H2-type domain-containing protein n=1 Tax=Aldrovandia affinis TaxID=143900 RepID=A0AAD7T440_9TELE|nr:hypothetical protein AAFF_G00066630 [Aldrovandia affinis]
MVEESVLDPDWWLSSWAWTYAPVAGCWSPSRKRRVVFVGWLGPLCSPSRVRPPWACSLSCCWPNRGAPYFWECRAAGAPGFPTHAPHADGQEDGEKCPHQDSESSDASFGDLSDGGELKSQHKAEEDGIAGFACSGGGGPAGGSGGKLKADSDKKHPCTECGQAFRSKSYLNKHLQRNMSLLESFGFQIVQSAFASSLADSEAGHSTMGMSGKSPGGSVRE